MWSVECVYQTQGRNQGPVASSFEHGDESSGSVKCGNLLKRRVTVNFSRRI
jgi:hypothetical protein